MIETVKSIILDFQEIPLETGVPRRLKVQTIPGKATIIGVARSLKWGGARSPLWPPAVMALARTLSPNSTTATLKTKRTSPFTADSSSTLSFTTMKPRTMIPIGLGS